LTDSMCSFQVDWQANMTQRGGMPHSEDFNRAIRGGLFVFVDGQGGIGRAADDLRGRQRERPASVLWAIGSLTNKDSK
jgi:hypothetical protein